MRGRGKEKEKELKTKDNRENSSLDKKKELTCERMMNYYTNTALDA